MKIGDQIFENPVWLAPMAVVTDQPVRRLRRSLGAIMAISEMVHLDPKLWATTKGQSSKF